MTEDTFILILKLVYSRPMTKSDETTWRTVWRNRNNPEDLIKEV